MLCGRAASIAVRLSADLIVRPPIVIRQEAVRQEVAKMTLAPLPEQVRQLVARVMEEFGARLEGQAGVAETIIVDDGKCLARSYVADRLMAMWFVEEGIVQFYDSDGNLLRTANLLKKMEQQRSAA